MTTSKRMNCVLFLWSDTKLDVHQFLLSILNDHISNAELVLERVVFRYDFISFEGNTQKEKAVKNPHNVPLEFLTRGLLLKYSAVAVCSWCHKWKLLPMSVWLPSRLQRAALSILCATNHNSRGHFRQTANQLYLWAQNERNIEPNESGKSV